MALALWLSLGGFLDGAGVVAAPAAAPAAIPQKIFTFWETPPWPPSVQRSIDTWRKQNPEWQIQVLTPSTLREALDDEALDFVASPAALAMRRLGATHFSDLVRVEVLAQHGGLWLDATVALTQPVNTWIGRDNRGEECLEGFDLDFEQLEAKSVNLRRSANWTEHFVRGRLALRSGDPEAERMPETWAFAVQPKCFVAMAWREAQRRLVRDPRGYVEALSEASEGLPSSYRKWLPHLGGSFSLWQAATHNPSRVHFRPAEDWAFRHLDYMPAPWALGPPLPLDYMTDYAGGPVFGLARPHEVYPSSVGPLMKLRRLDRCALDAIIAFRSYVKDSPLVQIYELPLEPRWWPSRSVGEAMAAFEANHCGTTDVFLQANVAQYFGFRKAVKSSHMKKVHEVVSVLSGQKPHEHADEEEIAPHGRGHPKDELHEEPVVKTQEMTKEEEKLFEKNGAQEKPVSPMEEKPVSPTMEEKPESPPSETEEVSSPSPTASGEDDDEDEDEDNEASSAEGSQGTSEPPQPGMDENKQTSKEDTGSGTDSTADTADDTADSANAGIDCGARKGAAKGSALWCGCNVNAQPVGSQELCEHPGGGRIDVCQWSSESSSCVPKSEKS
ncbi:unnamed protein product [Durusdinium trenchii]|uniref:Uncharacterized protein n=1 Tax=Durusdinium trenchii TaxID=1381693 RepID=A0ABP0JYF9_9DINO